MDWYWSFIYIYSCIAFQSILYRHPQPPPAPALPAPTAASKQVWSGALVKPMGCRRWDAHWHDFNHEIKIPQIYNMGVPWCPALPNRMVHVSFLWRNKWKTKHLKKQESTSKIFASLDQILTQIQLSMESRKTHRGHILWWNMSTHFGFEPLGIRHQKVKNSCTSSAFAEDSRWGHGVSSMLRTAPSRYRQF